MYTIWALELVATTRMVTAEELEQLDFVTSKLCLQDLLWQKGDKFKPVLQISPDFESE